MNFESYRSPFGSYCGLLTIESPSNKKCNILLDPGLCFEEQSDEYLRYLSDQASKADAVLLSSGHFSNCGALPYIQSHLKDSCRVYASLPSAKFGKHVCTDFLSDTNFCADEIVLQMAETPAVERRMNDIEEKFASLYSIDDIERAFSHRRVKIASWSELNILIDDDTVSSSLNFFSGITLQAFPAGYCISAAIWKITCLETGRSAVYGPKIGSIRGDFFCPPFRHESIMRQCQLLIIESQLFCEKNREKEMVKNLPKPLSYAPGLTKKSNEEFSRFLERIIETVFIKNGTVFIPSDIGDQMVGILVLLSSMWRLKGFENRSIIILSHSAKRFMSTTKSLTNFANDDAQNDIFNGNENPFDFLQTGRIIPVESIDEFNRRIDVNTPAVVVATPKSMQYGFSQEMLMRFGQSKDNCILFDSSPTIGSVAHQLIEAPVRNVCSTGDPTFYRSAGPTHTIRNIHFYLRCRLGSPAPPQASSIVSKSTSLEKVNQYLSEDLDQLVMKSQNEYSSSQGLSSQNPGLQCPPGFYISRNSFQETRNPVKVKGYSENSFHAYGEPISTKLLASWKIEESEYFAKGLYKTQSHDSFETPGVYSKSAVDENLVFPTTDFGRYAFNAKSYKSYKISLKVKAEIYIMNLENRMSLDELKNLGHSLPDSLQKCCMVGKMPIELKSMIEKEEFLPKSKVWFAEKRMEGVSVGDLVSSSVSIARSVVECGVRYDLNDPIWEIVFLSGTLSQCKGDEQLQKLLKRCASVPTAAIFEHPSEALPKRHDETLMIGDSSLATVLESKSITSVRIDDLVLANDVCAIRNNFNTVQMEEMLCMDALEVQDAVCNRFIEI